MVIYGMIQAKKGFINSFSSDGKTMREQQYNANQIMKIPLKQGECKCTVKTTWILDTEKAKNELYYKKVICRCFERILILPKKQYCCNICTKIEYYK